jgi:hypothetical protein
MVTHNPYAIRTPITPALASLLQDAARRLGLDDRAAAGVAIHGAVMIDRIPLVAFVLPGAEQARHDALAVATLEEAALTSVAQARLVLHTNMLLGPLSGFTFAASQEGELQLFCGMKLAELDGETLARTLLQLAKCAASMRDHLVQIGAPVAAMSTVSA